MPHGILLLLVAVLHCPGSDTGPHVPSRHQAERVMRGNAFAEWQERPEPLQLQPSPLRHASPFICTIDDAAQRPAPAAITPPPATPCRAAVSLCIDLVVRLISDGYITAPSIQVHQGVCGRPEECGGCSGSSGAPYSLLG